MDLNPFAVAIARFRLLVAALDVCGIGELKDAPGFGFQLAVGDSLLHGARLQAGHGIQLWLAPEDSVTHVYRSEDAPELARILEQQYHAVVGNPPYITVKDKGLNALYRKRFKACHRQYSLVVPFMASLAHPDDLKRASVVHMVRFHLGRPGARIP